MKILGKISTKLRQKPEMTPPQPTNQRKPAARCPTESPDAQNATRWRSNDPYGELPDAQPSCQMPRTLDATRWRSNDPYGELPDEAELPTELPEEASYRMPKLPNGTAQLPDAQDP